MNVDELNKIAEIMSQFSGTTFDGFIAWVALQIFENIWHAAVFIVVLVLSYKALRPLIQSLATDGQATCAMIKLRNELDAGTDGPLTSSEIDRILEKVRNLNKT